MLQIKFRPEDRNRYLTQLESRITPRYVPQKPRKRRKRKQLPPEYVRFNETEAGHYMYVYAPIEYCLLMDYCKVVKSIGRQMRITCNVLETISQNSDNPKFRSIRFRKAMIEYRKHGTKPRRKARWNRIDAVYFARHSFKIYEAMKRGIG